VVGLPALSNTTRSTTLVLLTDVLAALLNAGVGVPVCALARVGNASAALAPTSATTPASRAKRVPRCSRVTTRRSVV